MQSTPAYDALQTGLANDAARWAGRNEDNRLEPECWPVIRPRFSIRPGAKVFTVGSCFARAIESNLARQGFEVPALAIPGGEPTLNNNAYLNKYTPPTVYQELKWAHDILNRDDTLRSDDVEPLLYRRAKGRVIDMHLLPLDPTTYDFAFARREAVYRLFRKAFEAELVVVTLGLVEAWKDLETGLYLVQMPQFLRRKEDLKRFAFERLGFTECYEWANKAIDLVESCGVRKNVLLTTSPVPLGRTFTGTDVITANCYSKSVLRAVAGQIVEERPNVDYFPSYESVTMTRQPYVWANDLIHVASTFTDRIMERVTEVYLDRAVADTRPKTDARIRAFISAVMSNRPAEAQTLYAELLPLAAANSDVEFQFYAASLQLRLKRAPQALAHARIAAKLSNDPRQLAVYVQAARVAGEHDEANAALVRMVDGMATFPHSIGIAADRFEEIGLPGDAVRVVELARARKIANAPALLGLARRHRKAKRLDEAIAVLREAVEADEADAMAHFDLGRALYEAKLFDQAAETLRTSLELEPEQPERRYFLAFALEKSGRLDEAEAELRVNLDAAPVAARPNLMFGRFLQRCRRVEEARAYLDRAEAIPLAAE